MEWCQELRWHYLVAEQYQSADEGMKPTRQQSYVSDQLRNIKRVALGPYEPRVSIATGVKECAIEVPQEATLRSYRLAPFV